MAPPALDASALAGGSSSSGAVATVCFAEEAEVEAIVPPTAEGTVAKVAHFLRDIRGLSVLPQDELEAMLYESRFELLPQPKNGQGDGAEGQMGIRAKSRSKLPTFGDIPSQQELHDVLLGGILPSGHQCIAHVLYPDAVQWPFIRGPAAVVRESPEHVTPEPGPATPSEGEALSPRGDGTNAGLRSLRSLNSFTSGSVASGLARDTPLSDLDSPRGQRRHQTSLATQPESVADCQEDADGGAEVIIRGQKVKTTALGRRFRSLHDDGPSPEEESLEAEATQELQAARSRRRQMERAAQLEGYGERKLLERIQCLESMRKAEVEHKEALHKREEKRKARKAELKKQLQVDVNRKIEEEKAQQELEAEQKRKEAESQQRFKRYLEKQRERLDTWYSESCDDYLSRGAQAKLRYAEKQAEKKAQELARQGQQKTVKQLEALQRIHRIQSATEERPPLPPKPHDLPRPVLELVDAASAGSGSQSARSGSQSARSCSGGWTKQAKAVSNMYGLTEKEATAVRGQLSRGVKGAGRMASYEK